MARRAERGEVLRAGFAREDALKNELQLMKFSLLVLLFAGCAQPSSLNTIDGGRGGGRDLGGFLQFEDAGFGARPDLAGGRDLSELPDLTPPPDLALPPNADLSQLPDLLPPPDLATPPSVENCFNNSDDNGNGTINEGCPETITLGAEVPLTAYGGSGGSAVSAYCPAGQVAIGLRIYFDDWDEYISGVGMACSPISLVKGASSYSISVTMPMSISGYFYGGGTDDDWDYPCGAGQMVWTTKPYTSSFVDGLYFNCGAPSLALSPTNQLTITMSNVATDYGYNYGGGTLHAQSCGPSQVVIGYKGRYGSWLDQIQPICAPFVVNYKP
jgi:hypothetical protein